MHFLEIIFLCILSAVIYGILHDQVTARVCVEYFTIGHPPVFPTDSPTLLAFGWGFIATWWVGLILGVPVALASRVGPWPKYDAARLLYPMAALLLVMAVAALAAGLAGYSAAASETIRLYGPMAVAVPKEKHAAFLADACAHAVSYGVGFAGGLTLCGYILISRSRLSAQTEASK